MPNATIITEYVESVADESELSEVIIIAAIIKKQEGNSSQDRTGEKI